MCQQSLLLSVSCSFTQDIPSHFCPYVTSNIHHFLHHFAKTRQTHVSAVWVDGRGVCVCCRDVTRQSDISWKVTQPISLEHGWELPWQQISGVDEGWYWRRSMGSVRGFWCNKNNCANLCVRVCVRCHQDRCFCCLSFWFKPTSVLPWWLVTIVWHVPTKCLASGGQAHVLWTGKESRF